MVVVRMEREMGIVAEVLIEEYIHMMLGIVHQSERTYRTRLQPEILVHPLL